MSLLQINKLKDVGASYNNITSKKYRYQAVKQKEQSKLNITIYIRPF